MALLEIHDKPFNYLLQVENLYNKTVKRFDLKNKEYFDALRELRDNYNEDYNAIDVKANQLIYGNSEGKLDRKNRDRSDLYLKVVQRSEKYKTWNNFFIAIGAPAVIILIFQAIRLFFDIGTIFVNEKFDMVCHIILITTAWSSLIFNCIICLKSFKYISTSPHNSKAERKWLKKYFKNIRDIITAKNYLEILIEREEAVENYLDLAYRAIDRDETYQKLIDAKSELLEIRYKQFDSAINIKREAIYNMKKDIEKVMDDFMYDADVNTALSHVLENWKDY